MTKTLFIQAISRLILGIVVISILLFLPAGTINYPSAWWFLGLLFVPIAIVGVVLMLKNPSLLAKRLNIKERQTEQRSVVLLSAIMFVFGFISAGFSFRFQWLLFPNKVSYIASAVFLLAYILFLEVMRENVYLSRIVEVQENQKYCYLIV